MITPQACLPACILLKVFGRRKSTLKAAVKTLVSETSKAEIEVIFVFGHEKLTFHEIRHKCKIYILNLLMLFNPIV